MSWAQDKRFIEQCEREALHYSAAIQPHGCLLAVDESLRLLAVSANAEQWLGLRPSLGEPLPEELARLLCELPAEPGSRREWPLALERQGRGLDAVLSRHLPGQSLIELTASPEDEVGVPEPELALLGGLGELNPSSEQALPALRQELVQQVRELTGFARVMYYQFHEDGDGEVLAESRDETAYGSYLGLRFPASDIPQIARALYRLTPWRLIADIEAAAVPLIVGDEQTSIDLSRSDLRSVSPVHVLYLANMEVRASLSFPLVIGNELRGLIACHDRRPRVLPLATLSAVARRVRTHVMSLTAQLAQRRIRLIDGLQYRIGEARALLHAAGGLLQAWPQLGAWLQQQFAVDGAIVCVGNQRAAVGLCLEEDALEAVDAWFLHACSETVWLGDRLSRQIPDFPLSAIAGLLAVKIRPNHEQPLRIYLCRQEYIHEVAWGGNPDKPVERHDGQWGIAPRQSFEKWVEKRLGQSRPWSNEDRLMALKLRELLQ